MVPMTLTGTLDSVVRWNSQPLAALTDTSRNSGGPEIVRAAKTFPASSTVTSTTTEPEIPAARACNGYLGSTRLIALPCNTPPDLNDHRRTRREFVCVEPI